MEVYDFYTEMEEFDNEAKLKTNIANEEVVEIEPARRYIVRRLSTFKETGSRDWIALCERISNPEIRPKIPGLDILKNWTSRYNRKSGLESGFPKTPFTWNTHTIAMSNKNLAFSGVPNLLAGFGSSLQTTALNPAHHSLSPSSFPSTTGPNVQAGFGGSLQATSLNPAQHSSSPSLFPSTSNTHIKTLFPSNVHSNMSFGMQMTKFTQYCLYW
jgi:hypothetical protein